MPLWLRAPKARHERGIDVFFSYSKKSSVYNKQGGTDVFSVFRKPSVCNKSVTRGKRFVLWKPYLFVALLPSQTVIFV